MYASGVFILKQAFGGQNEYHLKRMRNELGLNGSDMELLGLSSEEIIGLSLEQIEGAINSRVSEMKSNYKKYAQLESLANKSIPDREMSEKIWVKSISPLIEYKPAENQNIMPG